MRRYLKLLPLLFVLAGAGASAAPPSAEDFLKGIYSHYRGDDKTATGVFLDKPADYQRYFEPGLARLMIADATAAAKRGDVPNLDGDPFIDAQDWTITNLSIHIDSEVGDRAKASVHFENFKKPETVHLDLVKTPEGWRIVDIVWPGDHGSLRALYKRP